MGNFVALHLICCWNNHLGYMPVLVVWLEMLLAELKLFHLWCKRLTYSVWNFNENSFSESREMIAMSGSWPKSFSNLQNNSIRGSNHILFNSRMANCWINVISIYYHLSFWDLKEQQEGCGNTGLCFGFCFCWASPTGIKMDSYSGRDAIGNSEVVISRARSAHWVITYCTSFAHLILIFENYHCNLRGHSANYFDLLDHCGWRVVWSCSAQCGILWCKRFRENFSRAIAFALPHAWSCKARAICKGDCNCHFLIFEFCESWSLKKFIACNIFESSWKQTRPNNPICTIVITILLLPCMCSLILRSLKCPAFYFHRHNFYTGDRCPGFAP